MYLIQFNNKKPNIRNLLSSQFYISNYFFILGMTNLINYNRTRSKYMTKLVPTKLITYVY